MADQKILYVTTKDVEQARTIGRLAVEKQLAACANILPAMHSIYRWEGQLTEDTESVLILKTTSQQVDALTAFIEQTHSYDCPCVLVLAIEGGSNGYLQWIETQTK